MKKPRAQIEAEIREALGQPISQRHETKSDNQIKREIDQVIDGPPAPGYTKFHKMAHGYPISFRNEPHGKYEILRRPSDFLVNYAAAIGKISGIKPIERIGIFPSIENAMSVIDEHHDRNR